MKTHEEEAAQSMIDEITEEQFVTAESMLSLFTAQDILWLVCEVKGVHGVLNTCKVCMDEGEDDPRVAANATHMYVLFAARLFSALGGRLGDKLHNLSKTQKELHKSLSETQLFKAYEKSIDCKLEEEDE